MKAVVFGLAGVGCLAAAVFLPLGGRARQRDKPFIFVPDTVSGEAPAFLAALPGPDARPAAPPPTDVAAWKKGLRAARHHLAVRRPGRGDRACGRRVPPPPPATRVPRLPRPPHATLVRKPGSAVHVVMDHYGTHKHSRVREWFVRHPQSIPQFTPTNSSWLNQVERSFAQITERRIWRGAIRSVAE